MANGAAPWDIYLACRASKVEDEPRLARLCALRLPVISRDFTATELRAWGEVTAAPPTLDAIDAARGRAEAKLVKAAQSLSTASVGSREFPFVEGRDTLAPALQRLLQQHAANAARAFATDSQQIEVLGFADYTGNAADPETRALAERRAQHVAGFLRRAGIPDSALKIDVELVPNPTGNDEQGERYRMASVGGGGSSLLTSAAESRESAFGLSPAEMAIGASDFLIERARQELEVYVFRVGVNRICSSETWTQLLRATCALLPLETDTIRYLPGASALQEALRSDLREMPYVVSERTLLSLLPAQAQGGEGAVTAANLAVERAAMALVLVRYLRAVAQGADPLSALALWEAPTAVIGTRTVPLPPRLRQVATLARFANSARTDLSAHLSGPALADTAVLYVLKALLIHGANAGSEDLWHRWATDVQRVNAVLTGVRTAQRVAQEAENDWKTLRTVARDSTSATRRAEIVSELISTATSLVAVDIGIAGVQPDPLLRDSVLEPARDFVVALVGDDSRAAVTSLVRLLQAGAQGTVVRLGPEYTRLLGFVNDAAQARTTDEFSNALESLVGPQGGYLAKRESGGRWYARLNAFVGGSIVGEAVDEDGVASGQGLAVGLTVPIGVEIGRAGASRRSNGVFLQFVDLGAIASARIAGNSDVEGLPDFKLGSVVGPGVFWTHGYRDSPLASAIGLSYFPEGRQAQDGTRVGVLRVSVSVAIDIPLFP